MVVLNYNGLRWLPSCLLSIARTKYPDFDVYLVDNASRDGSVSYVKRNFPWVRVLVNERNLGFAEAYNRAIKKIESEYVVLLNNDTEVLEPLWLNHLVEKALKDENIAAVACKMVSMENPSLLDSVGGMGIPYWRGFVDIGKNEVDRGQYDGENFEPFSFCGGAALLRRSIFLRLGGFDEKFFLYMEDVDLSWRFRLEGFKIALAPKARVAHYFSGSTGRKEIDARKLYLCHRNVLRAILKNCGSSLRWALTNFFLFSLLMIIGFSVLEPEKAVAVVKAILWNVFHFKDTYARRINVQGKRKTGEAEILRKIYPGIRRYEPFQRARTRKILNILFEYSQMKHLRKQLDTCSFERKRKGG